MNNTDIWEERNETEEPTPHDARNAYDKDYARIIHSSSFRRLQGKTQILNLGDSDFYRTRLTHSLEVSQIAGGIVKQLYYLFPAHNAISYLPPHNLVQTLGLLHDIGHPPFGHGGEVALNYCMREQGGFEGNGQTLRILTKLSSYSERAGANLTRRILLGALKYPISYRDACNPSLQAKLSETTTAISIIDRDSSCPPKCYLDTEEEKVQWLLKEFNENDRKLFTSFDQRLNKHNKARFKSLDCSIMDIADDISYGVHDLEDALALNLIPRERLEKDITPSVCQAFLDYINARRKAKGESKINDIYVHFMDSLYKSNDTRKHQISRLINFLLGQLDFIENEGFADPLLKYNVIIKSPHNDLLEALKETVREHVIYSAGVQHLEFKGQNMVVSVFEVLASEPDKFLPLKTKNRFLGAGKDMRVICDHVAGMTDNYLLKTYERLFSPRMGSIFDQL